MLAIFQFALAVLGGAGGLALWLYATGKLAGAKDADIAVRQGQMEKRLEDGGRRMSDLTSKMLILPTTMAQLRDEVQAVRTQTDRMNEHLADLRVNVARLEERHTGKS